MTESYAYQMAKMLLALAVVLALFGGGAYLFKRYVFGRGRGLGRFGGSNAPVKVLSRNFIESRKNIAIETGRARGHRGCTEYRKAQLPFFYRYISGEIRSKEENEYG